MSVKNLTLLSLILGLLVTGCGRRSKVRTYTEVIQLPPQASPADPSPELPPNHPLRQAGTSELPPDHPTLTMRAPPLTVEPVPENRPPDHPTLTMSPPALSGGPAPADSPANAMLGREGEVPPPPEAGDLVWTVPPGWRQHPPRGMRVASFSVEGDDSGALATLIVLGEQAGGLDANLRRWRRTVDLPEAPTAPPTVIQGTHMTFTFVSMVDESMAAGKDTSTIVAVYDLGDRSAFLRFTGQTGVLQQQAARFLALADSLRQVEGRE